MWFYTPWPPSPEPCCYWRVPTSNFLIGQAFSPPGMDHFSSKNVRIEVSEITYRITLFWLLGFKTVVIILLHNAIWNVLKHFLLTIKIFLKHYSLIAKDYRSGFSVLKLHRMFIKLLIYWDDCNGGCLIAQTFTMILSRITKWKVYMHLPINQAQLNIELAFIFQQQFLIWIPMGTNWKVPMWI